MVGLSPRRVVQRPPYCDLRAETLQEARVAGVLFLQNLDRNDATKHLIASASTPHPYTANCDTLGRGVAPAQGNIGRRLTCSTPPQVAYLYRLPIVRRSPRQYLRTTTAMAIWGLVGRSETGEPRIIQTRRRLCGTGLTATFTPATPATCNTIINRIHHPLLHLVGHHLGEVEVRSFSAENSCRVLRLLVFTERIRFGHLHRRSQSPRVIATCRGVVFTLY